VSLTLKESATASDVLKIQERKSRKASVQLQVRIQKTGKYLFSFRNVNHCILAEKGRTPGFGGPQKPWLCPLGESTHP
jgi:hypothetical protein